MNKVITTPPTFLCPLDQRQTEYNHAPNTLLQHLHERIFVRDAKIHYLMCFLYSHFVSMCSLVERIMSFVCTRSIGCVRFYFYEHTFSIVLANRYSCIQWVEIVYSWNTNTHTLSPMYYIVKKEKYYFIHRRSFLVMISLRCVLCLSRTHENTHTGITNFIITNVVICCAHTYIFFGKRTQTLQLACVDKYCAHTRRYGPPHTKIVVWENEICDSHRFVCLTPLLLTDWLGHACMCGKCSGICAHRRSSRIVLALQLLFPVSTLHHPSATSFVVALLFRLCSVCV